MLRGWFHTGNLQKSSIWTHGPSFASDQKCQSRVRPGSECSFKRGGSCGLATRVMSRWPPWCGRQWWAAPAPAACGCGWTPVQGWTAPGGASPHPSAAGRRCPQSARCPGYGCSPCPPGRPASCPAGTDCHFPRSCLRKQTHSESQGNSVCYDEIPSNSYFKKGPIIHLPMFSNK